MTNAKCKKCKHEFSIDICGTFSRLCPDCIVKITRNKFIAMLVAFIVGCALMPEAHRYATECRGYVAYGGEILIPFLSAFITFAFYELKY